jgi:hypothetical protein
LDGLCWLHDLPLLLVDDRGCVTLQHDGDRAAPTSSLRVALHPNRRIGDTVDERCPA